jgi:Fe-S cluster assembly protein SufD
MSTVTNPQNPFVAEYDAFEAATARDGHESIRSLRRSAIARFAELGLPTVREEEWRFTSIAPVAKTRFRLAGDAPKELTPGDVSLAGVPGLDSVELVLINGRFAPELSSLAGLPRGVIVSSLAEALASDNPLVARHLGKLAGFNTSAMVALNTAFIADGAFIHVPRGVVVKQPIEILNVARPGADAAAIYPRNLVVADEGAQVTLVENYEGVPGSVYLTNAVTEVCVGENAMVDYYRVQRESDQAYHFGALQVRQERASSFSSHAITFGAAISRNDLGLELAGEGAVGTLNGLYMVGGQQLADTHTRIDHAMPNCESHELYKGILTDKARGVFNGRILVRQDAQKTNAKQTNKNLLLSPTALVNTNPQLEIYADDVKCTHGATIGQMDEQSVFYLRSRGINEADARCLLTFAFANDIVRRIRIPELRSMLEDIVLKAQGVQAKPSALEFV